MKIESYCIFSPDSYQKQFSVHGISADTDLVMPLIYLQRPKWIKDDGVWEQICDSVKLSLPKDFEVR
jgi:hypothetical protein